MIDPCSDSSLCPEGTRCTYLQDGTVSCLDCNCGFCTNDQVPCCKTNGAGNNCRSNNQGPVCNFNLNRANFPAYVGDSGNACSGVEVSATATPNGCGCQPSADTPCTYDLADQEENACFVCRKEDLVNANLGTDDSCDPCIDCIKRTCLALSDLNANCIDTVTTMSAMKSCLADLDHCSSTCARECNKAVAMA